MLRFIHCADLHFDRSFEGLHAIATKSAELLIVNEQVLAKIVTIALEEKIDFLLFAGDTFHQNRPSLKTQHQFFQQMQRLNAANIPVYLIFGNHDYYEEERYWFDFPENVILFTEEQVTTVYGETQSGEVYAISGFSYRHSWIKESKIAEFPLKKAQYHIGMYHGDSQSEHYAPFQVQEMRRKNYDYWALGHIHVPTVLSEQPPILYPGTPQGHTKKEENIQGIRLVTLNNLDTKIENKVVATIDWVRVAVSLTGVRTAKAALEKMQAIFQSSQAQLVALVLLDTDFLPANWLTEKEKPEIIDYLNDFLQKKGYAQIVYQLQIQETFSADKFVLTGKDVAKQLLESYQEEAVFSAIVEDLGGHSLIKASLNKNDLQVETFQRVQEVITNEFCWSEDER